MYVRKQIASAAVALGVACAVAVPIAVAKGPAHSAATAKAASSTIPSFVIGTTGPPQSVSPTLTYDTVTASPMFQGLTGLTAKNAVTPLLAQSISRPSPTEYVFHLRHDVKFWDGNPMTSADVAFSLGFYTNPKTGGAAQAQYRDVKSITANGPYTVTVKLKQPNSTFENTLAWDGTIFEKSFYLAHQSTFGQPGTLIEATGPFQITSFDPSTSAQFVANPHYWGGPVNIQKLTIQYFASETSEALAFRTGQIDAAFPTEGNAFASASGAKLKTIPANAIAVLGMNVNLAPFKSVEVRRAIAYAMNRPALIKAYGTPATPLYTMIPPTSLEELGSAAQVKSALKGVPTYPYSIAKAKAELAKSPYPHGFTATIDTAQTIFTSEPMVEAIAGMLSKIGIKLNIKVIGANPWLEQLYGPKTTPLMFSTINIPETDPSGFPSWMLGTSNIPSGEWNFAAYGPKSMDKLLAEGTEESKPAQRLRTYAKVLKMVGSDVPYIAMFTPSYNLAISPKFAWPEFNDNFERTNWETQIVAR